MKRYLASYTIVANSLFWDGLILFHTCTHEHLTSMVVVLCIVRVNTHAVTIRFSNSNQSFEFTKD
jgi:hypothetical protein